MTATCTILGAGLDEGDAPTGGGGGWVFARYPGSGPIVKSSGAGGSQHVTTRPTARCLHVARTLSHAVARCRTLPARCLHAVVYCVVMRCGVVWCGAVQRVNVIKQMPPLA